MQIDHINIKAPRRLLEQVREFYCTVLGLDEGARPDFPSAGYWLYSKDHALVHLSVGSETAARGTTGFLDHVAFRSEGLAAFLARLDAQGIEYRCGHIPELALTQLFLRDPAGTGLEVNFAGEVMP